MLVYLLSISLGSEAFAVCHCSDQNACNLWYLYPWVTAPPIGITEISVSYEKYPEIVYFLQDCHDYEKYLTNKFVCKIAMVRE